MYKPIYNEESIDVVNSIIDYLHSTRLEKSFIDTDKIKELKGDSSNE